MHVTVISEAIKELCQVSVAFSGKEALRIAHLEPKPDLIILDVMMPEMSGFEVCKMLKSDHETKDIPVIFITGKGDDTDEQYGFDIGAIDYITKPINVLKVKSRVKNVLQRQKLLYELNYKLDLQRTVTSVAECLLNKIGNRLDDAFDYALMMIGEFFHASSIHLSIFSEDLNKSILSLKWLPPENINDDGEFIARLSDFPFLAEDLWQDSLYYIKDVDLLPINALNERNLFKSRKIKSALFIPIKERGFVSGFVCLNSYEMGSFISDDDLPLLKLSCDIIINALLQSEDLLIHKKNRDDTRSSSTDSIQSEIGGVKYGAEFTVLIADNDKLNLFLTRDYLKSFFPNSTILKAENSKDILDLYNRYTPSIIITDINIHGKSVFETVSEIRVIEKNQGSPESLKCVVIGLSFESADLSDNNSAVFNEILIKPTTIETISETIVKYL